MICRAAFRSWLWCNALRIGKASEGTVALVPGVGCPGVVVQVADTGVICAQPIPRRKLCVEECIWILEDSHVCVEECCFGIA